MSGRINLEGQDVEILEVVGLDEDLNVIEDQPPQKAAPPKAPPIPPATLREDGRRAGWRQALQSMLPALDALENCVREKPDVESLRAAVRLALREMWDVYRANGLERIEGDGVAFDPRIHEAALVTPTDRVPDGTILETLRAGYLLRGEMVRAALVRVAVPLPSAAAVDEPPAATQIESESTEPIGVLCTEEGK